MAGHRALGRGLDALFSSTQSKLKSVTGGMDPLPPTQLVREIAVDRIKPNRHQPRMDFDPAALEELSQSIKSHGLAQPLVVTEVGTNGEYELVAGERRLRAAKMAGLLTVPCSVKKLSNRERFELALIENIQREDLNALEEAVALEGLMREYNLTQDEVATAIGKSRSTVANILRFLRLHEKVQGALRSGAITEGHAKCLAGIAEHSEQLRLLDKIILENLSVRDLEAAIAASDRPRKNGAFRTSLPVRSPEVKKYEEDFQRRLGRRVEIKTSGKKGWLQFEFYSPADLDLLCQRLGLLDKNVEDPVVGS